MANNKDFRVKNNIFVTGLGTSTFSGDVSIGDTITVQGAATFQDEVNLNSALNASSLSLSGNATISGNLTVSGTTTWLNSTNTQITDRNIVLNYSTGDSSGSANGAGITIQDAVNSTTDATILWDATNDEFDFSHAITLPDSQKIKLGTGADFTLVHNGTDSFITNDTGIMYIRQNLNDGDILLQSDNGSGGVTTYIQLDGSAQLTNFAQNTKHNDSVKATFGASQDLQIYHDGTQSIITDTGTGQLKILAENTLHLGSATGDEAYIRSLKNGAVTLYHDNSAKLATTSTGIDVTGSVTASDDFIGDTFGTSTNKITWSIANTARIFAGGLERVRISGTDGLDLKTGNYKVNGTNVILSSREIRNVTALKMNDNNKILLGTSQDFEIFHNATNNILNGVNGDIVFQLGGSEKGRFLSTGFSVAGNTAITGNYNTSLGGYQINGTTVINSSKELRNIEAIRIQSTEVMDNTRLLKNITGIELIGTNRQIKFLGDAGPFGLEFGDTEANPNFRVYYRTTPNTLTFENNASSAKHTFDLSGNYTATGKIIVGTFLEMSGGSANSINFEGTGSDTAQRKILYEDSGHHYVTNRHTDGDLVLMSNNGTGGGETARMTLQAGSGTQDIDITNANLDLNSNNITSVGTISNSGTITSTGSDHTFYSGGSTQSLAVGRLANQSIKIEVTDNNNIIQAFQDSDSNGNHYFDLRRDFEGTGSNLFRIRKGTTTQIEVDGDGDLNVANGDLKMNGQVVITNARALTNISTISSGAITSSGTLKSTNATGLILDTGSAYRDVQFVLTGNTGNGTLEIIPMTVPGSGTASFTTHIKNLSATGTTRHDLKVDGTISSGAITSSGKLEVNQAGNGTSNVPSAVAEFSGQNAGGVLKALSLVNSVTAASGNGTQLAFHNASTYSPTGTLTVTQAGDVTTDSKMEFQIYRGGLQTVMRIDHDGHVDLLDGNLKINGTTVIDTSRNLLNINTINLGGELNFTGNSSKYIDFNTLANSNSINLRHHNPTGNLFETAAVFNANGGGIINYDGSARMTTQSAGIKVNSAAVGGVAAPILNVGQLNNAYQSGMESSVHLTMKTYNPSGNFYFYKQSNILASIIDGDFCIGQTAVIDSSRNLTNIASANIGGGTSYFSEKLLVEGLTRFAHGSDGVEIAFGTGYSNHGILRHDDQNFIITMDRTSGTGNINLTPYENVNITTGALEIGGTSVISANRNLLNIGTISSGAITASGTITSSNGTVTNVMSFSDRGIFGTTSNHPVEIRANGTEAIRIDTAQRVGIGTSSPSSATNVHLQKDNSAVLRVDAQDGGSAPAMTARIQLHGYEGRGVGIKIKDSVNSASGASSREWFVGSGYGQSGFNIGYAADGVQSSYAAQSKLTIQTDGDVGIGTSSPAQKLEVAGRVRATTDPTFEVYESSSERAGIQWVSSSNLYNIFSVGGDIRFERSSSEIGRFTSSGLSVSGSAAISGNYNTSLGGYQIAGTTVIDSSRNLLNLESIKLADNKELRIGSGNDLVIDHNGTDSIIKNNEGDLVFKQEHDDKDIIFQADNGSGGVVEYLRFDGSHTRITANKDLVFFDNIKANFGTSSDLQIYHDGSNSYIKDAGTGTLRILSDDVRIMNAAGTEISAQFIQDGEARLKYDNVTKLATKSTGIDVTGTTVTDILKTDGGTYAAGVDTQTDAALVIPQTKKIYSLNSSGNYLRNIFYHDGNNGHYIFGQTGTSLIADMLFYAGSSGNFRFYASGSEDVRIDTTGNVNLKTGALQINGSQVITSSRNLTNIGTISSGEITSTGSGDQDLTINSTNAKPRVLLQENGTTKVFLESFASGVSGQFGIYSAAAGKYALLIDTSGNTSLNGGTLTSGAITSSNILTVDYTAPIIRLKPDNGAFFQLRANESPARLEVGHSSNKNLYLSNTGNATFNYDLNVVSNFKINGTTVIDSSRNIRNVPTAKLTGGTFSSGIDSYSNSALVIAKGNNIYSDDGNYLRNLIGHASDGTITIGQFGTALISNIKLRPGSSGSILLSSNGSDSSGIQVGSSAVTVYEPATFNEGITITGNISASGAYKIGANKVIEQVGTRLNIGDVDNSDYIVDITAYGDTSSIVLNDGFIDVVGDFDIAGSLSKNSGSFKINHPLKPDTHHLVHSFVEGPQADNLYRGKIELVDGRAVIDLDEWFGMTPGTFLALNRDLQAFVSNEEDWDAVRAKVMGSQLIIECQNARSKASVSWMVVGERQDNEIYESTLTDDYGKIIVEPEKKVVE